ncbi:ABC-type phosphate/phosphonate transport system, substrate-binding protein [Kaistia soli DSM 19436]|uniref:ABC-type phosphate/phosphonate transport system, substrate-binding protein n=1 Tax=Kaistia soli DSM 19436 TaxID=1122133 RepID=A0A1M4WXK9_9HYPH|nr:PhnD/SsuA/transferrin family substrate-binding protein [Kaistia soli]SHE85935.1 ABC-type phosphate/phosphonate transport system, substrate-binding protein [Kaistia soli DSM 19436]
MTLRPASLPMYGIDPVAVAAFWRGLAAALRAEGFDDVPDAPAWPDDLAAHWRDPDLLLSQTCGYPLVEGLDSAVTVVGAFRFDAPGASGTDYASVLIVRDDDSANTLADLRGRTVAYNAADSQSGYNALRALVAPLAVNGSFFRCAVETGAHRRSVDHVRAGKADLAAIDSISFALIARHDPAAVSGLRIIGRTAPAPGLPLITAGRSTPDEVRSLRGALAKTVIDPRLAKECAALLITGFEPLGREAYDPIAASRRFAIESGYPELA